MDRLWGMVKGAAQAAEAYLTGDPTSPALRFRNDLSSNYEPSISWDVLEGPLLRKLAPHPALALASTCTRLYRGFHLSVEELPLYVQRSVTDMHLMLFPNLKTLDLSLTVLYDQVSPQTLLLLSHLTHLTLNADFQIEDEELGALTQLTHLNMGGCRVLSGAALATLTNLIRDKDLVGLTKLERLSLRGRPEDTGSCLSSLPNLTWLDISGHGRKTLDLTAFRTLAKLKTLFLDDCGSGSPTDQDLQGLSQLEELSLDSNTSISDAALKTLPNLTSLTTRTQNDKITGAGLASLPNLRTLRLTTHRGANESMLKAAPSLTALHLSGPVPVEHQIALLDLLELVELRLQRTLEFRFELLPKMPRLRVLHLNQSDGVFNPEVLNSLPNLVDIALNFPADLPLSVAADLKKVLHLDIRGNPTISEEALKALPSLRTVMVDSERQFTPGFLTALIQGGVDVASSDMLPV